MKWKNFTMNIQVELMNFGGFFDLDSKQKKASELKQIMESPDFWTNQNNQEEIIKEYNNLKKLIDEFSSLKEEINNNLEMISLLKIEFDDEIKKMLENNVNSINKKFDELEILTLLDGPYDKEDAIFEIHSGAGGTEANDWVSMLYRMYFRYFEKKGYKVEVLAEQKGEEAGFKTVSLLVKGNNAYGYLKNEKGVHRLVRISPFDANSRRHTSFASVDVTPFFDKKIDIEINENDLTIDVFRSGGAGGQHVNTTDSAVRITHIPTGLVVTCQNERSQIQNREKALDILKNKLYKLELEKQEKELKKIKGGPTDINFGSQIRSYVLHPYSMVKDHRTNVETGNATKVLDGDLDIFINASLKINDTKGSGG
ncbi:MAG: peptide chain release factor 2 [Mollicutes bacterium]|nr:peptide chain release factor 2 [Mollicutes bacterium]